MYDGEKVFYNNNCTYSKSFISVNMALFVYEMLSTVLQI